MMTYDNICYKIELDTEISADLPGQSMFQFDPHDQHIIQNQQDHHQSHILLILIEFQSRKIHCTESILPTLAMMDIATLGKTNFM